MYVVYYGDKPIILHHAGTLMRLIETGALDGCFFGPSLSYWLVPGTMTEEEVLPTTDAPNLCYVFIHSARPGERVGIVKRGERGYYLTDFDSGNASNDEMEAAVRGMNEDMGVSEAHAEAMVIGSMFGWDVPGAQVKEEA